MATKTAVAVVSDPNGGDEAVGHVFNAGVGGLSSLAALAEAGYAVLTF